FLNLDSTSPLYTLSLHDALPICPFALGAEASLTSFGLVRFLHGSLRKARGSDRAPRGAIQRRDRARRLGRGSADRHGRVLCAGADRKSTRLNSSHRTTSYAVFCL